MIGGHSGTCSLNKKTDKCKKSSTGSEQCELSKKGACKKKQLIQRSIKNFIRNLEIIIKYYELNPENIKEALFKNRNYVKFITILKLYPKSNIDSLLNLKKHFIHNGIKNPKVVIEKAEEYLKTGHVTLALKAINLPEFASFVNLTKIYGIGPAKAKILYKKHHIVSHKDLSKKMISTPSILNPKQKIGLKYFTDLDTRIPRKEIDAYKRKFTAIQKLVPGLIFSINGSYRRGLGSSGDIDVLITASNPSKTPESVRKHFIKLLLQKGIIIETLAAGKTKFMGVSKLTKRSKARHIDIIDTTPEKYCFAQLYFTGSGGFNIQMRTHAKNKGYILNEQGINDLQTKKPVKPSLIQSIIGKPLLKSEKDIFNFLGLKYLQPSKRNAATKGKIN